MTTDQDHAKIVPNGEPFTDEDGYAVADEILEYFEHYQIATLAPIASIIRRERHNARLAAEAAAFEKAAGVVKEHQAARLAAKHNALERGEKAEARDHESMAMEAGHILVSIQAFIRKLAGEKHD